MSHVSQTTSVHQVPAAIWSPDKLRDVFSTSPNATLYRHAAVALHLPRSLVEQIADGAITKTCALVELRGKLSDTRYALLTIQTGDKQLVVVSPMASNLARGWLLAGTKRGGRYRFLTASPRTEVVTPLNVPYLGDETGAAPFRESLEFAAKTGLQFSPQQHREDFAKVTEIAALRNESASLLEGFETTERYVATVVPADWCGLEARDNSLGSPPFKADEQIAHH